MRRETRSQRPLFFPGHFLSGTDNWRVPLFKAYSGHGSIGNCQRLQRGLSPVLDTPVQILIQGWKWAFYGWSPVASTGFTGFSGRFLTVLGLERGSIFVTHNDAVLIVLLSQA
jgi:hypothetical protein